MTGGKGQWHAEISLTGFGTGMQGRYWLTGVEWGWRIAGEDGRESLGKRFKGNERQQILDLVNREILPPEDAGHDPSSVLTADAKTGVELGNTPQPGDTEQLETKAPAVVDAPLVRLVNFIRELASPSCGPSSPNRALVSHISARSTVCTSHGAKSGKVAWSPAGRH